MTEDRMKAYQHLGLTGYAVIKNLASFLSIQPINIFSFRQQSRMVRAISDISEWLGVLMNENVSNF